MRWLGKLWYRLEMICTATSVLPVPGGPTTIVRPGFMPDRMASTCTGVKGTRLLGGFRLGYGPRYSSRYC